VLAPAGPWRVGGGPKGRGFGGARGELKVLGRALFDRRWAASVGRVLGGGLGSWAVRAL